MATIKVTSKQPIYNGSVITFEAPCDCTEVDYLKVCYPILSEGEIVNTFTTFALVDAHNREVAGIGNLFEEGAYVRVVLDVDNEYAYIQNGDTNSYLENKMQFNSIRYGDALPSSGVTGDIFFLKV